ncbi:heme exporter protein CcmD [Bartonella sp. DGB2]|uniref:heme exporter protein CcmD n=1 Tax=Bartonella sp. DGB2 TaxID=3388426 RepID=UPI00398FE035
MDLQQLFSQTGLSQEHITVLAYGLTALILAILISWLLWEQRRQKRRLRNLPMQEKSNAE